MTGILYVRARHIYAKPAPETLERVPDPLAVPWGVVNGRKSLPDCKRCDCRAACSKAQTARLPFAATACEMALTEPEPPKPRGGAAARLGERNAAQVLELLAVRGPAGAQELADELGFCVTTVRTHLKRAVAVGQARTAGTRGKLGKPAETLYAIVEGKA